MKITYVDENGMKLAEPGCLPMVPLRDYFAAAALTGWMSNEHGLLSAASAGKELSKDTDDVLATIVYRISDAMLKVRREDANTTK